MLSTNLHLSQKVAFLQLSQIKTTLHICLIFYDAHQIFHEYIFSLTMLQSRCPN